MGVFHEFDSLRSSKRALKTFLALIPKKTGASKVKDFCPISLVNGVYKTISKVLSNRTSMVMEVHIEGSKYLC